MKSLHRIKAIAAYNGARKTLQEEMDYPSYMLLKEAARGILSYMVEDSLSKEICEKTKLDRLLSMVDTELMTPEQIECIQYLIDTESGGLVGILAIDTNGLLRIKKAVKELIITYLKEPV